MFYAEVALMEKIVYNLRMEVFEHIENMSQNQFNMMPVGSLVTRVANYTTAMSDLFTNVLVSLLRNALTIVGVYIIMFYLSWKLSLVLFGFVVVVFIASFIFRKVITKIWRKERQYTSDLNTFLNENLSGMKIIQIFNQEKRKEGEFNEKNELLRKTKFKAIMAFACYRPFINFLYFSALAVTFIVGVSLALTAGEIVAFYLYLSRFFIGIVLFISPSKRSGPMFLTMNRTANKKTRKRPLPSLFLESPAYLRPSLPATK